MQRDCFISPFQSSLSLNHFNKLCNCINDLACWQYLNVLKSRTLPKKDSYDYLFSKLEAYEIVRSCWFSNILICKFQVNHLVLKCSCTMHLKYFLCSTKIMLKGELIKSMVRCICSLFV